MFVVYRIRFSIIPKLHFLFSFSIFVYSFCCCVLINDLCVSLRFRYKFFFRCCWINSIFIHIWKKGILVLFVVFFLLCFVLCFQFKSILFRENGKVPKKACNGITINIQRSIKNYQAPNTNNSTLIARAIKTSIDINESLKKETIKI